MNCQRCKKESVSWTNDTVVIVGEVAAHLCVGCQNEWAVFISKHPVWKQVMALDARSNYLNGLAAAQTAPSEQDWLELREKRFEVGQLIREVALEFIKPINVEAEARSQ